MTDTTTRDPQDDLTVVAEFLNRQLDPERMEIVRRRLEEDPAFRELAAPLLYAWSVPPNWESDKLPPGEIEQRWEEFTRQAGFIHQKRKARRRWLRVMVFAAFGLGLVALAQADRLRAWYVDHRDYMEYVWKDPADWMPLRNGALVKPEPGARIRLRRYDIESVLSGTSRDGQRGAPLERLKLWGTVHVRAVPFVSADGMGPIAQPVSVTTRACVVVALRAEFTVSARGDTTDVEVHVPTTAEPAAFVRAPTSVMIGRPADAGQPEKIDPVTVREGRRARCIDTRRLTGQTSSIRMLP